MMKTKRSQWLLSLRNAAAAGIGKKNDVDHQQEPARKEETSRFDSDRLHLVPNGQGHSGKVSGWLRKNTKRKLLFDTSSETEQGDPPATPTRDVSAPPADSCRSSGRKRRLESEETSASTAAHGVSATSAPPPSTTPRRSSQKQTVGLGNVVQLSNPANDNSQSTQSQSPQSRENRRDPKSGPTPTALSPSAFALTPAIPSHVSDSGRRLENLGLLPESPSTLPNSSGNEWIVTPTHDLAPLQLIDVSEDFQEVEVEVEGYEADLTEGTVLFTEPLEQSIHDADQTVTPPPHKRTRTFIQRGSPVRKRIRNECLWKRNVSKVAKNLGLQYVSVRGKVVSAVTMKDPCSCSWDCRHRLAQEVRDGEFKKFWALGNHERQWDFIRKISRRKATFPRVKKNQPVPATPRKKWFYSYFFKVDGNEVKVCKKMFLSTLGIGESWVHSAWNHLNPEKGDTISPDKRGRHGCHPIAITPEKIATVKEHVNSFPRVPSHYCRRTSKREYPEHGLSGNKMAKLYAKWVTEKNLPSSAIANLRQYKDILNSNFNISFFKPKKELCALCSVMRNKHNPNHIRLKYKDQWIQHIKAKEAVKKMKSKDRAEAAASIARIAVCSYDLQKQLCAPKSEVSSFYFKNKLSVFNFTIFHEVFRKGRCYLWHEGLARKGSAEISSAVLLCIKEMAEKGYQDIRFYSDNCAGQNKNRMMFAMYAHAAALYSIKITHRFLEPGHTHMDADTIHARIENSTDGKDIWDFDDWVEAIEEAKEELPKYEVIKLDRTNVFCFKPLVSCQNWSRDEEGNDVKWSKIKEVHVDGSQSNLIKFKYDVGQEYFILNTNKQGRPVNLRAYKPRQAYGSTIPIAANVKRDLQKLCNMDIPLGKQQFFRNIINNTFDDNDDPPTEPEYDSDEELCLEGVGLENVNLEQDEGDNESD